MNNKFLTKLTTVNSKKSNAAPAFILVLTMVIISLLTVIVTQMFFSGSFFSSYAAITRQREKAKVLAESGVRIACAQLYVPVAEAEKSVGIVKQPSAQKQEPVDQTKKLLEQIIPVLNTWQAFTFNQKNDGVDGTLDIYITCEEGKIHLNDLLTLMTDAKLPENRMTLLKRLFTKIAEINQVNEDLSRAAIDFFEQRKHIWLNDVTELLNSPGFAHFNDRVFVTVPVIAKDAKKDIKPQIFLTDIFTPQSRYGKLNPWVLSASVCLVLGAGSSGEGKIQDRLKTALKSYKKNYNWSVDWDVIFKPVYGIEYAALGAEIASLLAPDFNPVAFTVVSYATVGAVTQGVFFLLLRKKQQDQSIVFIPIKSYWI
jgi:flagellar basal body-associated protein FliL